MNVVYAIRTHLRTEAKFADEKAKELLFALMDEIGKDMSVGGYNPTRPTRLAQEMFESYIAERNENKDKAEVKKFVSRGRASIDEEEDV